MYRRNHPLLWLPLLTLLIACQTVPRLLGVLATPTPTALPALVSPEPILPTSTSQPKTATPSPTPQPTASPLQFQIFEELWQIVQDEYLYPDFNGLDWQNVHTVYRQKIVGGLEMDQFYTSMNEMLALLKDDHSYFLSPDEVAVEDAELAGKNDYAGVGLVTVEVPDRNRLAVVVVFPGSPAEQAGIQSHDSILTIDGLPAFDATGPAIDRIRGRPGTTLTLGVQSPGQPPRLVQLTRQRIQGALPLPHQVLLSNNGKHIAYVLLASFADDTLDDKLGEILQADSQAGDLDGLILDNRQNPGGMDTVTRNILSYFTKGDLGYFIDRHNDQHPFLVESNPDLYLPRLPLVVLIGTETASFAEIFSGVLQDGQRAHLIGSTTQGNLEIMWSYVFSDGSRAWIAHEAFRPKNHPQQNWELSGIIPDQVVTSNWDEVTLENDPVIVAALAYLEGQIK
jgi:carboxyl-terminal processing protease